MDDTEQIEANRTFVLAWLENTPYAATSLTPLVGGKVNFAYVATLETPLRDGSKAVFVKHSLTTVRHVPEFKVSLERVTNEFQCIRSFSEPFSALESDEDKTKFIVQTPNALHIDASAGVQIHSYLPDSVDLRSYILTHSTNASDPSQAPIYHSFGAALGRWTRCFHSQATTKPELVALLKQNNEAQQIKQLVNYQFAVDRADMFPEILGEVRDMLVEVQEMARRELEDQEKLCVVHGDFNPFNIILPNTSLRHNPTKPIPILVVDWELAHLGVAPLDTGQMIAQLFRAWHFDGIPAGRWLLEGFCVGYGPVSEEVALRTAVHVGVYLLAFVTIDEEIVGEGKVEDVARMGRDVMRAGWKGGREWLEEIGLGCLFGR